MKQVYFLVLLLFTSCDQALLGEDEPIISLEENLSPPPLLNDGWEVSNLAAENIVEEPITTLIKNIQENSNNIHSLLIIRNNKLVSESYFDGWHRDRLHTLRSASKSFVSTLTGIAIDKGHITVDDTVYDFFPEYDALNTEEKKEIKIKHLLTMTPGLQWNEVGRNGRFEDSENDENIMDKSDDRLKYFLEKEVVTAPGRTFNYNSGSPVIQAAIINRTVGMPLEKFAEQNLLSPLNITDYYWRVHEDGVIYAAGPLHLKPRDMAKLGQVFLDNGQWHGQQIVSSNWVNEASTTFIGDESRSQGYGYNWWTGKYTINNQEIQVYRADGNGGQFIFVIPNLNAVVAFTGGNFFPLSQTAPFGMLQNTILPAMQ